MISQKVIQHAGEKISSISRDQTRSADPSGTEDFSSKPSNLIWCLSVEIFAPEEMGGDRSSYPSAGNNFSACIRFQSLQAYRIWIFASNGSIKNGWSLKKLQMA